MRYQRMIARLMWSGKRAKQRPVSAGGRQPCQEPGNFKKLNIPLIT